jgi:tight adherence protein B
VLVSVVALLAACGVVLLGFGIWRARRRATTTRRLATILAMDEDLPTLRRPSEVLHAPPRRWRLEIRQALARLQARDTLLRTPAVVCACICGILGLATVSAGWLGLALLFALAAYWLGRRERRRRRIEAQALNAMQLFASGLRAGYSVGQAITLVARHSPEPTATEFALAAQEVAVGVSLPDAIARLAARTANPDYDVVAIIVRVQHEVGGNLAQILDSVGSTLRERVELRQQVNALTAQQRMSSIVLTVLPFALLLLISLMDRSFVEPLFSELAGRVMLAISAAMVLVGWSIMRSVGRVEV